MKWCYSIILVLYLNGCTVKVEPLPKTPAKKPHLKHNVTQRAHPTITATPTPKTLPKAPLQLEPTEHPTPMIQLPNTTYIRSIHPMDMYLG